MFAGICVKFAKFQPDNPGVNFTRAPGSYPIFIMDGFGPVAATLVHFSFDTVPVIHELSIHAAPANWDIVSRKKIVLF